MEGRFNAPGFSKRVSLRTEITSHIEYRTDISILLLLYLISNVSNIRHETLFPMIENQWRKARFKVTDLGGKENGETDTLVLAC